jgi:hypothetical protein
LAPDPGPLRRHAVGKTSRPDFWGLITVPASATIPVGIDKLSLSGGQISAATSWRIKRDA